MCVCLAPFIFAYEKRQQILQDEASPHVIEKLQGAALVVVRLSVHHALNALRDSKTEQQVMHTAAVSSAALSAEDELLLRAEQETAIFIVKKSIHN